MRNAFVHALVELASQNRQIELITGDLGFGVLKPFWEGLPDQFTNAGVAEQNMISVAAGMALEGKTVFVYSIGNFPTLRCLEQIRNDCAYHKANVKIVCVGGGFAYGSLGASHHATEDLACLRAIPNMTVMAPGDAAEADACVRALVEKPGPAYLRLGRGGEMKIHENLENFAVGKALKISDGERVAFFSTGIIYDEVAHACDELKKKGLSPAVYTFPTIKPLDVELIESVARDFELIATCEGHNVLGGFGSAVAETLAETPEKKALLLRFGVNDNFASEAGNQAYLRTKFGMNGHMIAEKIIGALGGAAENVQGKRRFQK